MDSTTGNPAYSTCGYRTLPPATLLNPAPVALVSCADRDRPECRNLLTVAWAGTVNSDPPMVSVSIRKSRYSHGLILRSGEFVINLTTEKMVRATDLCGVLSGRDVDKFARAGLHEEQAFLVSAPLVKESPVSIECRVKEIFELGTHDMFLAEVVSVDADEAYFNESGKFMLEKTNLIAYSHGEYRALSDCLGTFGFSVRKKPK